MPSRILSHFHRQRRKNWLLGQTKKAQRSPAGICFLSRLRSLVVRASESLSEDPGLNHSGAALFFFFVCSSCQFFILCRRKSGRICDEENCFFSCITLCQSCTTLDKKNLNHHEWKTLFYHVISCSITSDQCRVESRVQNRWLWLALITRNRAGHHMIEQCSSFHSWWFTFLSRVQFLKFLVEDDDLCALRLPEIFIAVHRKSVHSNIL